jgi:hypothetical protein
MPPSDRFGPCYVALVAAISADIEDELLVLRGGRRGLERAALQADIDAFEAQLLALLLLRQGSDAFVTRAELPVAERQAALQGAAANLYPAAHLPEGPSAGAGLLFQAARELGRRSVRGRLRTPASSMERIVPSSRRH